MLVVPDRLGDKRTAHGRPLVAVGHHHARAASGPCKRGIQQQRVAVELREFWVLRVRFLGCYTDNKRTGKRDEQKAGGEFRHGRTEC